MKKRFAMIMTAMMLTIPSFSYSVSAEAEDKDAIIAQLEERIVELEGQVADLEAQLEEALQGNKSTTQDAYQIGETWVVENQWKVTVKSVEEDPERNEFSDYTPEAVYIVTYEYENLGYDDDIMDGLFISLEDGIVDQAGKMGYGYPGDVTLYPQETPVGAVCEAQACIGVDNAGDFKINFSTYDSNDVKQSAVFEIKLS